MGFIVFLRSAVGRNFTAVDTPEDSSMTMATHGNTLYKKNGVQKIKFATVPVAADRFVAAFSSVGSGQLCPAARRTLMRQLVDRTLT